MTRLLHTRLAAGGGTICASSMPHYPPHTKADELSPPPCIEMAKNAPIPLSRLYLDDDIRAAMNRALDSGQYVLAQEARAFEDEWATYCGSPHAVLSSSWTMSVHLLLQTVGLHPGDEVIVPAHTAFPTIEPLVNLGATPVFVDVDDTYCLDPDHVAAAITSHTVGLLPVHLYGHPANMDAILHLAQKHSLWVLEDGAQAHGATFRNRRVGSMGTYGAFSFFPSKNLTVYGDGGCITTADETVAAGVRQLRNHGRTTKYVHEKFGTNARFNEIQAAAGRLNLRLLDNLNAQRRAVAAVFDGRLRHVVQTPIVRDWAEHVYHLYVIRTPQRDALASYLKERGIATGLHYPVPNHRQPAVVERFGKQPALPRTEALVDEILSLPISGAITLTEAERVCDAIEAFFSS